MAIEVRIPTILRTYTGGAKSVEGSGGTLAELLGDLDSRHHGLRDRLVDQAGLRRFVNVYLNDEDVRFLGGLETPVTGGEHGAGLPPGARRRWPAGAAKPRRRLSAPHSGQPTGARCVTTRCSTRWAGPRWWGCRGCHRPRTCGYGRSSKTGTRPGRSRTARRSS